MNTYHFVLFALIAFFVCVEQYNEIYRLSDELKAQNLDIKQSRLFQQMKHQMQSLEADRDDIYAELLAVSRNLKMYKNQAEREIYELKRTIEMEREKLRKVEQKLSYAKAEMERLNGCTCICNPFQAFGFCTRALYRMATFFLRRYIGSNLLLKALDYVFDLLEPQAQHLQIEYIT